MIEYYNDNPSSKPVMISNDEAAKKCKMEVKDFNKKIAEIKKELFLKVGTNYSIFIDCDRIAYSY